MAKKKYTKREIEELKKKHKDIVVPDEDVTRETSSDSSFNKDVEKIAGYKHEVKE